MAEDTTTADPIERIATSLATFADGVREAITEGQEAQAAEMRGLIEALRPADPDNVEPGAPEGEPPPRVDPLDSMVDQYSSWWSDRALSPEQNARAIRANFEVCMLISSGARRLEMPVELNFPDEFLTAARAHIFESAKFPAPRVYTGGSEGKYTARNFRPLDVQRAMDSQESGFGSDLVDVEYISEMWMAARNRDTLVNDIRTVPMTSATQVIPIDGAVPEMLLVSEKTSAGASLYTTSKTASSSRTLTSKKFTIQQDWSAELEEDAVIAFVPFLREMLGESAALHLGSAYYNGDSTNAGSGNLNLDDADPADSKHYLAWDGIRHYWIVDATGQGKDMGSALDLSEVNVARGKLNGTDDDLDSAVGNINWGQNPRDLRIVCDWDTYMAMLSADTVTTVDKYGPAATVLTGELGSYAGIPIISPSYAVKTEADGKQSTTEASNTKGQLTVFAPRGFIGGVRRETQLFFGRIQGQDQFKFELYSRRAFQRHGANVAAGIYDITI